MIRRPMRFLTNSVGVFPTEVIPFSPQYPLGSEERHSKSLRGLDLVVTLRRTTLFLTPRQWFRSRVMEERQRDGNSVMT